MSGRALVSGGAGFIGSHVADLLLQEGYEVEILDNLSSGRKENVPQGAIFHQLDIASDEAARVVLEGRFDVLFHLAAQIDVRKSVTDPVADARINILGTLNLLEAVRASGFATRVIFSSTGGAIYGDFVPIPSVEDMPKDPESPYGIAKLSAELYLAYYGRVHNVDTVALRYANVYGPRQDPHGEAGVVAIFCGRILQGRALTIYGDGQQTRDYVYVGDVAEALWHAATRPLPPVGLLDARGFNVGTGVGTSVVDMANILLEEAGTRVPLEFAPRRPGEAQESFVDIGKAERLLGWKPRVTLREGLARSFRWAANRQAAPAPTPA